MKNLKIGKKLLVTFGSIIILFCITVIISLVSLINTGGNFEEFYEVGYPVSLKTAEMRVAMQTALKEISQATITEDISTTNELVSSSTALFAEVDEGFLYLNENFQGDKAILQEAKAILDKSISHRERLLELASRNANEEAADVLFNDLQPITAEFQEKMIEIDTLTSQMATRDYNNSKNVQNLAVILAIAFSGITLVTVVLMAIYITRSLTAPITEIEVAANKIVKGDLNTTIQYQSADELGSLSESMRKLTAMFRGIIGDMSNSLGAIGEGDFTVESKMPELYVGDFSGLLESTNMIIKSLSNTLSQINQSSEQVANGSNQVASGSQALSQGATEQASSIQELSASINQISEQVKENANSALQANNKSMQVGEEITQSKAQMDSMIEAMADITTRSQEIQKIIKAIDDIAFQTNILALNAAVEAARAGAAGKGFAVVADEVRSLASKSAEAAKNTATLIEASIEAVGKGTQIADETAKSLVTVVEGSQEVSETVNKIAMASNEQATSISQVTQGVEQISAVVQTNSATAEESAAASEELNSQAQLLKEIVSKFTLSKDGDSGSNSSYSRTTTVSNNTVLADGSKY